MATIPSVKGTRDFYPEELAIRRWLYEHIRAVSESFGYQEYDGPFLERLELYAAKSGEELVKEQSFVFPDRGGDLVALRPELTLSLARMVAQRSKSLPQPIRWWSFGPFWRYERPQKGRTREFFQWNIDLVGVESPEADAEIAAIGASFFRSVGLGPEAIRILVNDRRLAERQLDAMGIPAALRPTVFRLVDRREKLGPQAWSAYALEVGLSSEQLQDLTAMLEDRDAWRGSSELVAFFAAADALGVRDYLAYDPTVIRGLDYYTGMVFEARDAAGEHRAILGGGRYDNLVRDVGGGRLPGTGFAMGDVVLGLVLEAAGIRPALRTCPSQILVTTFDAETRPASLSLCQELRRSGLRAEWYPEPGKMPRQLKYADRLDIPVVAILGPDELQAGTVTLKHLPSGRQISCPRGQAGEQAKALCAASGTALPSVV
jgi:histidyl-tRNA synthetase